MRPPALVRRIQFTGILALKTAMHVGSSWAEGSASDSPVIRTPDGAPFIPGSSFKGAFRSTVEKMALTAGVKSCGLMDGNDCIGAQGKLMDAFNTERRTNSWGSEEYLAKLDGNLCDTCKLFGSQYAASHIFFSDLLPPPDDTLAASMIQVRDGVAIDRDSEKAVDRLKYDYEVVAPAQTFTLNILLEDPTDTDLALTCLGLSEYVSGFGYIGGKKSRGLGACTLRDLVIYELDLRTNDVVKRAENLRRYLVHKEPQDKMTVIPNPEAFLDENIQKLPVFWRRAMLKRLYNEARFTLSILTTGPVLVRSGFPTLTGPDMTPVLTYRNGDWQVYLPGSSLKGVIRSHLEKICRTLRSDPSVVCDPFRRLKDVGKVEGGALICTNYADVFCGDKFERRSKDTLKLESDKSNWRHKEEKLTTEDAYGDSCPICRLFGSTEFIGRVSIGDGYLDNKAQVMRPTELRDGVGIDRLTGGAFGRALFNLETVSSNVLFRSQIHVRNFEDWQLGMLLVAAQDMTDGLIRIGSGRSRGFGSVTAKVHEVTVSYIGPVKEKPANEVWGMGKFLDRDGLGGKYRTFEDDVLTVATAPATSQKGIRRVDSFRETALTDLMDVATSRFVNRIEDWETPKSMEFQALNYYR